jgi:hypothetical protein
MIFFGIWPLKVRQICVVHRIVRDARFEGVMRSSFARPTLP